MSASSHDGMSEKDDLVCLGVISGARGLKGEVRIKSFTEEPLDIASYGVLCDETRRMTFNLHVVGQAKGQIVARLDGIRDRTAADAIKGKMLYAPRQALPETEDGEFYHNDLVGLNVSTTGGENMGTVRAVRDYGAGVFLEIDGGTFGEVMVPFTLAAVPLVDLAGGRLEIDPPVGLFEPPGGENGEDVKGGTSK